MTHQEQLIIKQYPILLERIKRQNLLLESFIAHLGFTCEWTGNEPLWKRIPANKRPKRVYVTLRAGKIKRRNLRGDGHSQD